MNVHWIEPHQGMTEKDHAISSFSFLFSSFLIFSSFRFPLAVKLVEVVVLVAGLEAVVFLLFLSGTHQSLISNSYSKLFSDLTNTRSTCTYEE